MKLSTPSPSSSLLPENRGVWSDLRSLQSLARMQQEIVGLQTSISRLKRWLILGFLLLGSSTIALGTFGFAMYRQQPWAFPEIPSHDSGEVPSKDTP